MAGSATAATAASTMLPGVGRSGSPMAKEMTSTPRARASAMRRSSDAKRYGGGFSTLLSFLLAPLSRQGAVEDVLGGSGLVEVPAGPLLHQQVAPQGTHGGPVEAGRHHRGGRAGGRRQR